VWPVPGLEAYRGANPPQCGENAKRREEKQTMRKNNTIRIVKEPDEISTPDYLQNVYTTKADGTLDRVVSSHRVGADDVRKYGKKKVLAWLKEDEKRLADYGNRWSYVGIRAEVDVVIAGTVQTLQSGGLWGIEDDSSEDYFQEVATEETSALLDVLKAVGIDGMDFPVVWE
jgi:hypothetical protein